MSGSGEQFAVCDAALQAATLILEIGKSAAELCQLPECTRAGRAVACAMGAWKSPTG